MLFRSITYGNLGPEYGNRLKDGSAMALFSAHRVADASSANALYATQYVRIVSQAPIRHNPPIVNKMRVPDAETVDSGVVEISDDRLNIILYPDNKRALVCLTVRATNDYYTSSPNAIASVIFNGVSHLIPEDLRPDLYKGQTLIVNLDVPIDD